MGRPYGIGPPETRGMSGPRWSDVLLLPVPGPPRGKCLFGAGRAVACLHLVALALS